MGLIPVLVLMRVRMEGNCLGGADRGEERGRSRGASVETGS
jgi:hypothetical protein